MKSIKFVQNAYISRALKISKWRRLAIGLWKPSTSPAIYCVVEVNTAKASKHIELLKAEGESRVTMTHFTVQAVAKTIERHPEINRMLRFGKLYQRKSVDICVLVAPDNKGHDLAAITIRESEKKSLLEIAKATEKVVKPIKKEGDRSFLAAKKLLTLLPDISSGWATTLLGNILYSLNIWSPALGLPRDPFGGIILTNIGSLGLDFAFAPLVPMSRVPMMIAMCAVRDTPIAENGQVVIAPMMRLCFTADHRLVDGVHGSLLARALKEYFEDPSLLKLK